MKRKKQWLALLTALCLLASLAVVPASAEGDTGNNPPDKEINDGSTDNSGSSENKDEGSDGTGDGQTGDGQTGGGETGGGQTGGGEIGGDETDGDETGGGQTGGGEIGGDETDGGETGGGQTGGGEIGGGETGGGQTGGGTTTPTTPTTPDPPAKPIAGDLSYDVSGVDFGTLAKGTSSGLSKTFQITNNGSSTMFLSYTAPSGFTVSGIPSSLAAGGYANVTVTVSSTSRTGTYDGSLKIAGYYSDGSQNSDSRTFSLPLYAKVAESGYSITVDPSSKNLGKLKEGYSEKAAEETEITVTIKNTGASSVRMDGVKGDDHFIVTAVRSGTITLENDEKAEYTIVPKQDLAEGTYTDTITFRTREGTSVDFKATVVIEKAVAALTVEPAAVDFGSAEEGYAQPAFKTVTVKNNTERAIRLEQPNSYSFVFGQLSTTALAAGASATFTIAPRAGLAENNYNGVVMVQSEDGESAKLDVRFIVTKKPVSVSFSDVPAGSTFADDISYVSQKGLMSGKGGGLFKPQDAITRGQLVTILYRLEGQPAVSGTGFSDVAAGSYCENAVKWAAANGITNGGKDGTFKPNDPITREQLATFLFRYNNHKGYDVTKRADLSSFPDGASVASYAKDALSWANGAGLVNGTTDGRLNPSGGATRGQAAAILHRFCVSIGK